MRAPGGGRKINRNMGCIEILEYLRRVSPEKMINRNMGCIEIKLHAGNAEYESEINRNMGCIEMRFMFLSADLYRD